MESCNLLINNGWLQLYCNIYFLASPETWRISKPAKWKENPVRGVGEWPMTGGVLTPNVELFSVELGLCGAAGQLWQDGILMVQVSVRLLSAQLCISWRSAALSLKLKFMES